MLSITAARCWNTQSCSLEEERNLVREEIQSMLFRAFTVYTQVYSKALRVALIFSLVSLCIFSTQQPWLPCTSHYAVPSSGTIFLHIHWLSGSLDCLSHFFTRSLSVACEGFSAFMLVTVAVKHLWNRSSGSGGWLSQSSFLLMKCFLNPCGPETQVALTWLGPSLGSPAEKTHRRLLKTTQHLINRSNTKQDQTVTPDNCSTFLWISQRAHGPNS